MIQIDPPARGRPFAIVNGAAGLAPTDVPEADLIGVYKQHGAVLMRGFDMDLNAFRALTSRYCASSVFNESRDRELIDGDANIQTVNGGVAPFPLHPELSRHPWKPDVCFFYCIDAPGEGGETTLCDGAEIVRMLAPAVRSAFEGRRLLYRRIASPQDCAFWLGVEQPSDEQIRNPPRGCPYTFHRTPEAGVIRAFMRPALHRPMFHDALAWGNFLFFARYQLGRKGFPTFESGEPVPDQLLDEVKAVADALTAPIPWREGDVIMIDNTRFMHGRNAILNPRERRIASYFGYLRFAEPDADEIPNAPWRQKAFRPPSAPEMPLRR